MHTIELVMGDYSRDGHEKTESIMVISNITLQELKEAYQIGTEKIGFDFIKTVAADYGDGSLSKEKFDKLRDAGLTEDDWFEEGEDKFPLMYYKDAFAEIFLFICKLGNELFEYEYPKTDSMHIGGYGLFN